MHAYVIVRDGVVVEQYQTTDSSEAAEINARAGAVQITGFDPMPQCGWTYSGGAFAPPLG